MTGYVAAGMGLVILALSAAVWVQTARLDAAKAKYATFKAGVEALGRAAEVAAKKQTLADIAKKEKSDAENSKTIADLRAVNRRMRNASASRSFLPAPTAAAPSPATATVDRPKFERAMEYLDERGAGIAEKGDEARINLDSAIRWAAER